ncbi:LacI family DNA-binding transcriptional regulator [Cellulomonas sp. SLBN-39]|uniref:LacI family DNA-binding transcriptional regulator n=1 Tax=Cellulomonas sp. SLBN-39 TaxID=2768446 RepID=UPI00116D80B6|nr:LacI family DNA-binding transcriptional regulator [Cellulomonas sp. SLBN-39]TQL03263.1 LacI family transcriptional regulator [Cellulomonas sp. SLBN-39]
MTAVAADGPAPRAADGHAPARPPAMSDVAALAGVSHQTVSRVLNDHPSVRPATRARVVEAIATLGYRRNLAARALVTRRTGTIGVITPATALYGPTSTLVACEQAARDAGAYVSVATLRTFSPDDVVTVVEHFLVQGVDGIVVVAPRTETLEALRSVHAPVPVVVVSSAPQPGGRAVAVDQHAGGRMATEHLLALGHETVVHVAGPPEWFDAGDRLRGWRAALEAADRRVPPPIATGWSAADGFAVGGRLVAQGLPSAVFAANDQLALGLLRAFRVAGVRVPQDVAVVGFDDEPGTAFYDPPLTTVRQGFAELGRRAVRAVLDAGAAGPAPAAAPDPSAATDGSFVPGLIAPELVVRESTVAGSGPGG